MPGRGRHWGVMAVTITRIHITLKPWVLAGQSGFVSGKVKSSASTEVWLKDQLSASPSCGLPIIQAAGP